MLTDYGNTIVSPNWAVNQTKPAGFQRIYFFSRGNVVCSCGTECIKLEPNVVYFFPTATAYKLERMDDAPFSVTYLHQTSDYFASDRLLALPIEPNTCLDALTNAIKCAIDENRQDVVEALSEALLCYAQAIASPLPAAISRMYSYINEHLDTPISLDALSRVSGYHPRYIIRLFQKHTGISPHQYIMKLRLAKSAGLLRAGYSVGESAAMAGYESAAGFARAFRAQYGVTPGDYAKQSSFTP